ncbi:MAG TPA: flagellar motor protein MotB [Polyangiaceae bacterium]|nr:flagellar motor protein MotB [Polyangiaceae bacterium]
MARKKKHEEHVNHERWVISYADFVTLLFAFFVVMFAVSQVDSKKVGRFTQSFNAAMTWDAIQGHGHGLLPGETQAPPPPAMPKNEFEPPSNEVDSEGRVTLRQILEQRLGEAAKLEGLTIEDIHGELVLRLPEHLLFDNAQAALKPDGRKALEAVADSLEGRAVFVRIEGHTDSMPIRTPQFPTNWELSTARATACVRFMLETKRIAPERLSAAGYGQHHPVATNDTAEGRARNRRVDIVIAVDEPKRGLEPPPVAAAVPATSAAPAEPPAPAQETTP